MCSVCKQRPRAINCYRHGQVHYRSRCENCIRKQRQLKPAVPRWQTAGYRKKPVCDRCGFRARYSAQLLVYHVDGDLNNCALRNLRTVCLNCVVDVTRSDAPWRPGDLEPDS